MTVYMIFFDQRENAAQEKTLQPFKDISSPEDDYENKIDILCMKEGCKITRLSEKKFT